MPVISIPKLFFGWASRLGDDLTFSCSGPAPASEVIGTLDGTLTRFLINAMPGMSKGAQSLMKATVLGTVPAPVPVNKDLPTISGTAQEGQVLSVCNGTWTNDPTSYNYQWTRDGTAISGAINSTRTLVAADVGHAIACTVTAANDYGSGAATSVATGNVTAAPTPVPANSVAPVVSGSANVGQVLSVTSGTWSNAPTGYAYAWRRDGVDIAGATAATYTLVLADGGKSISCRVYATNAGGTAGSTSNAMAVASATVTLSAAQSKAEGNSGATLFTYTVTLSAPAVGAVIVPWSFAAGTASPNDFTGSTYPAGGSVTIADGATSGTLSVSVNGDTTVEGDETFTVSINPPSAYVAGTSMSATGTILNDDSSPVPPAGFSYLLEPGGSILTDTDGSRIMEIT